MRAMESKKYITLSMLRKYNWINLKVFFTVGCFEFYIICSIITIVRLKIFVFGLPALRSGGKPN
jgi:hypothetical protein